MSLPLFVLERDKGPQFSPFYPRKKTNGWQFNSNSISHPNQQNVKYPKIKYSHITSIHINIPKKSRIQESPPNFHHKIYETPLKSPHMVSLKNFQKMLYHHENRFQAWKCIESTHNEQTKPRINIARNQEQSKAKNGQTKHLRFPKKIT